MTDLQNKAADTVITVVDSLRSVPALLIIVILNVLVVGSFMWFLMTHQAADQVTMQQLLDKCLNR